MVLLVIDVQKGITDNRLYNFDGFIRETKRIIDAARLNHVGIIYVQHDDGPETGFSVGDEDFEIAEQVAPKVNDKIFYKTINSCFGNRELAQYLQGLEDKRLMIVGLQTNFCIDASVKSAFERGFKVIIPKGTNSTFDNDYMDAETTYKYYNEMMWPERFAQCVSVEEAISMMER
jgi:nicotinamidase-related amidase